MSDISELEPNLRACALVGLFLQAWAHMEYQLNFTIGQIFRLDTLEKAMLCSNLQFYDKINVIKSVTNLEFGEKHKTAIKFSKVLEKVRKSSADRNMMAHCQFGPDEKNTGTLWFVIRAKGKLMIPDVVWPEDKFYKKIDEIYAWYDEIKELQEILSKVKLDKLIARSSSTNQVRGLLGLAGLPYPPAQADHK